MVESPFALKAREECGGVLDDRPCAIHAALGRAGRESSMALNVAVQNGPIDTINIAVDSTSRSPHAGTQALLRETFGTIDDCPNALLTGAARYEAGIWRKRESGLELIF
jgi:hypothetical protein